SREKEMARLLSAIASALETQPFLLGESLSAADIAVGSILAYMTLLVKLSYEGYPAIEAYLERLTSRPAFHKSIGARSSH
ncbi:MAG TPA: glutathione binding-like protein, partial [Chroococcidiopsis sp.]